MYGNPLAAALNISHPCLAEVAKHVASITLEVTLLGTDETVVVTET